MIVYVKTLRSLIVEIVQASHERAKFVPLETLMHIQDELDEMLSSGEISTGTYDHEWSDTLASVGWTQDMYEDEIDRRWDYIDSSRGVAPTRYLKN